MNGKKGCVKKSATNAGQKMAQHEYHHGGQAVKKKKSTKPKPKSM